MRKQEKVTLLVSNNNIEYCVMKRVCFFAKSNVSTKICVHILCLKIESSMLIKSPFNFTMN